MLMNQSTPLLSICIPAYNRPKWFKRALESIILGNVSSAQDVEIIISDDSLVDECRQISEETLVNWKGSWKYVFNQPRLGMARNWNHSIQLASGEYILVLHDDDFLRDRAVEQILNSIKEYRNRYAVLLFGVDVVNDKEKVIKRQTFPHELYLQPKEAIYRLLSNSSFVRFPAICIRRKVFGNVGYFDEAIGGVADLDMWIRLSSKFGVIVVPVTTCAYTVHSEALTMGMFNSDVIGRLLTLFSHVKDLEILIPNMFAKCKSNFFHQFILAGTFRALRRGKLDVAKEVLQLFKLDALSDLKFSLGWVLLRRTFEIGIHIYSISQK
jgi:glycosyltransferase involved in cell wall biosynthesis